MNYYLILFEKLAWFHKMKLMKFSKINQFFQVTKKIEARIKISFGAYSEAELFTIKLLIN